jgi:thiamine biosynthesis lipoprotein
MRRGRALAAILLLVGCAGDAPRYRETLLVFGSRTTIEIRAAAPERARAAVASLAQRFAEYDRDWHPWEPGALTEVNAALARGARTDAPASIRDLVRRSRALHARGDGLFDPAIGGLLALWGFHTSEFPVTSPLPDAAAIAAWRASRPSILDVEIEGERIWSRNPAVRLDFGAIAEGVAVEEAGRLLADHGIHHALITLGGDVYALGRAGERGWRVGISDPYGGVLAGAELEGPEALFASGNYNKFREAPSGARWPHILDPRTGEPVRGSATVAVIHRDPVLADVAATVLMIGGPARFAALSERLGVHCALLLTDENELMITAAMEARIELQRDPVRLGAPLGTPGPCSR